LSEKNKGVQVERARSVLFVHEDIAGDSSCRLLEIALKGSGFDVEAIPTNLKQANPPDELIRRQQQGPLFCFLMGEHELPEWLLLPIAEAIFENKLVLFAVPEHGSALQELKKHFAYVVSIQEDPVYFLRDVFSSLHDIKEKFLWNPAQFTPKDKVTGEMQQPYNVLAATKDVVIGPDGHGYIEFVWEILITGNNFKGTTHYFGLDKHVPSNEVLPSFQKLLSAPQSARFNGASFHCRVLTSMPDQLTVNAIEIAGDSTPRVKAVRLIFTPEPRPNTWVKFAWSWSYPNLFVTEGEDESSFHCLRNFRDLHLTYHFEHPDIRRCVTFQKLQQPTIKVINPTGLFQAQWPGTPRQNLHCTEYRWRFQAAPANSKFIVRWSLAPVTGRASIPG